MALRRLRVPGASPRREPPGAARLGDGAVIVTQLRYAPASSAATHSVQVRVEDADRHHEQAARYGARILQQPTHYPYGERQYSAEDPGGHRWTFSQSIVDFDPASSGGTAIDPG